jgi:penicillin-binding protein 1A
VRRYLVEKYGKDQLLRGGLRVYTTLDLKMQEAARSAIQKGLEDLDKREGYRGPVGHLSPDEIPDYIIEATKQLASTPPEPGSLAEAVVEVVDDEKGQVSLLLGTDTALLRLSQMKWARKPDSKIPYYAARIKKPSQVLQAGDIVLVRILKEGKEPFAWEVSLEQAAEAQAALLSMVPDTGEVKAMVGGRDYTVSQFNRAVQARRQPGSAFKPFIYAAALDRGMSPGQILIDAPYVSDWNPEEETWKPKNYKGKFFGPTLFRTALAKSRNVITVKILKKIGVPYVIEYARKLGIESDLSPDLSLALGSSGLSLMELTRGYAVFANGGLLVRPIFIKSIVDRSGRTIEENQPQAEQVISKETAFVMTDLLEAVIKEGTGWRIKALKRPVAGKTGTTNNLWDAWFMGFTPELVTGAWVGYDDRRAMGKGETGSRAASPIWLQFMSNALKDRPVADFQVPEGVVFARIDAETGLLAGPHSKKTVLQAFKEGTEPREYSPRAASPKSGQFFQYDMGVE